MCQGEVRTIARTRQGRAGWRGGVSFKHGCGSGMHFLPKCIQTRLCAQVKVLPCEGGCGENALAELSLVEDLRPLATSLDHGELAGQRGDVDPPVCCDG